MPLKNQIGISLTSELTKTVGLSEAPCFLAQDQSAADDQEYTETDRKDIAP